MMSTSSFNRKFKPIEFLNDEQIELIHSTTLNVLKETGLRFESKKALDIFKKNDCLIDYESMRVKFPEGLVGESLNKAPSSFTVKARDPEKNLIIGGNSLHFFTFPGMKTIDLDTWEPRIATKKENNDAVIILDALENIHFLTCYTPYYGYEGISDIMVEPESFAARIRNSSKVQMVASNLNADLFTIRMAQVSNTEVFCNCMVSPPLTYNKESIDCLFRGIEAGFPIWINSGEAMGGSGPSTIAGSIVSTNAELIGPIVLSQLLSPGSRNVIAHFIIPVNMRSGSPFFGSISCSLHQVAFNQMWRRYKIPFSNDTMGATNSKIIDFQSGFEKTSGTFTAALSGANLIQLYGGMYGEIVFHPVQAILDDDIAGAVGKFIEGFDVNKETLALELIKEVGPMPGFYLNTEHTKKWWKSDQYIPKCFDTLSYPEWLEVGKKNAINYAKDRYDEILSTHKNSFPLTEEQDKEIQKILEQARNYYSNQKLL